MALLFSTPLAAPFGGMFADDWGYGPSPFAPMLRRCGSACPPPLGLLPLAPARPPPAAAYRLHRPASYAPPTEPEVHVRRTPEGVLATCPLGRGFSSQDISLQLSGRDFTITAFHPGTASWCQRPAAYRQVLELAEHIDARRIEAALERGVLTIFFPYRRQQPHLAPMHAPAPAPAPAQQRPRLVFVHRPAAPAPAPAPALVRTAAPVSVRPSMPAAPAAPTAPSTAPCARTASGTAPVPCSFRRAHHCRQQRLHFQYPMQRRCPEQAFFGPPLPTSQRQAPLTQHRQPTASPQQPAAAAPARARAPALEPLLRPASPTRRITIPVEGPTSPAAAPTKAAVPAAVAQPEATAAPAAAGKGKAPASPEQAAAFERQQRAAAAQARIAAGIASDSDWEDADGLVSECSLEN